LVITGKLSANFSKLARKNRQLAKQNLFLPQIFARPFSIFLEKDIPAFKKIPY
jgi:hypothetical protein